MASVKKREWGDGKSAWVVRWMDGTGHRSKQFDKKKDADAFRASIVVEVAAGKATGVRDVTVAQAVREYARHVDQRFADGQLKRGSHANIVSVLNRSVLPHLASLQMKDVDAVRLERWFDELRVGGLSARTAMERLIYFSSFWKFAKRRKLARGDNPASEALENIGKVPKPKIRTISAAQAQAIIAAADVRRKWQSEHSFRLTRVAVGLAAFSGLRIGEILALRLADVDLTGRRVHVRHTLNDWDELTPPKTADSYRVVPIAGHVADMIAAYIANGYVPNERELIFRTSFGRKHPAGSAIGAPGFSTRYWQPLVEAAGLHVEGDNLHFHALRHFAASWWLRNKMPITDASRLLGHANPQITLSIYSHVVMEEEERHSALDTMSVALLGGANAQGLLKADKILQIQSS